MIWAVMRNFNKLPEEVRNKLLLILAEKDEVAYDMKEIVVENFNKLPEEVIDAIIRRLGEKGIDIW